MSFTSCKIRKILVSESIALVVLYELFTTLTVTNTVFAGSNNLIEPPVSRNGDCQDIHCMTDVTSTPTKTQVPNNGDCQDIHCMTDATPTPTKTQLPNNGDCQDIHCVTDVMSTPAKITISIGVSDCQDIHCAQKVKRGGFTHLT
jgi:hypothetical protein